MIDVDEGWVKKTDIRGTGCQEASVIDIATWELDLKQPRK
jgi:hypothetical protein